MPAGLRIGPSFLLPTAMENQLCAEDVSEHGPLQPSLESN